MTGRKSRDKGKRGELEACELLRRWFADVERNLTETREGQGIDVMNTAPFGIQVKRHAKITPGTVVTAWHEAVDGVDNHTSADVQYPVVLHRSDRQPWQLTICAVDLVNIYCGNSQRTGALGTFDAEGFFEMWDSTGRPA